MRKQNLLRRAFLSRKGGFMTKKDLLGAYYLEKEIELLEEGKERTSGTDKRRLAEKISELIKKRQEIHSFIMAIDDPQTRLIAELRCMKSLKWNAVADKIGGMNSEYTVKKRFYRFLDKVGA